VEGSSVGGQPWNAQAFELFKLLHAAGMTVRAASPLYLEWTVSGCDDVFRASYEPKSKTWAMESREWSGSRWIPCDGRIVRIALGGKERVK
jgi:hypothetical protein